MAISLQKGQKISLEKKGESLQSMCFGVNWGAIEKKGFFGNTKKEAVDLDASVAMFDESGHMLDVVYFGQLSSRCKGIVHSGDDRTGDLDGDDGLDNEVIIVNFNALNPQAAQIAFLLNSFQGHDFKNIPFASIRLYNGTAERVDEIHAKFDIANDPKFAGSVSMIMGKAYKHNGAWKFAAIGETTADRKLQDTVQTFAKSYL